MHQTVIAPSDARLPMDLRPGPWQWSGHRPRFFRDATSQGGRYGCQTRPGDVKQKAIVNGPLIVDLTMKNGDIRMYINDINGLDMHKSRHVYSKWYEHIINTMCVCIYTCALWTYDGYVAVVRPYGVRMWGYARDIMWICALHYKQILYWSLQKQSSRL